MAHESFRLRMFQEQHGFEPVVSIFNTRYYKAFFIRKQNIVKKIATYKIAHANSIRAEFIATIVPEGLLNSLTDVK